MKVPGIISIAVSLVVQAIADSSPAGVTFSPEYPFGNRIVMSQTPEIGEAWHGGVRMKDIFYWDLYWNAGGWLTVDLLYAGLTNARLPNSESGDTVDFTDNMILFTVKSRPLTLSLKNHPYKLSGGLSFYSTTFEYFNPETGEGFSTSTSRRRVLFITQSWFVQNRHYVNILTSIASRKTSGTGRSVTGLYVVPGYRCFFGKNRRWSFDIEYYYMNPVELPFKTLQILSDPDQIDFYNPDQRFISFMFWGFSYSGDHLRIEAHLGNHISFAGLLLPLLGIGWDF